MTVPTTVRLKDGRSGIIRRAEPPDAAAWIANVNTVAAEGIYVMTEVFTRSAEEVAKQFESADPTQELWLVAEVEGTLVGGADFRRGRPSKNAHVASLGVALRRAYREIGLGRALMESGIDWARSVGVTRLRLGVFASNEPALRLYQKLGFVEEGRLRGEVVLHGRPTDEILMALTL